MDHLKHIWYSEDASELAKAIACYLSEDVAEDPKDVENARLTRENALLQDSIDEMKSEIAQLRIQEECIRQSDMKNALLQDSIDDMKWEIAQLQEENTRKRDLIQALNCGRPQFRQPPAEILRLICSFVIPPSFLLDPSVSCGPDSPWCQSTRGKMVLTNVCRAWYGTAIEMLYEEVALRSIGQVSALLRTLRGQTSFGPLIRKIGVHCVVPDGCGVVFEADLKDLVERTPNLTSVVLNSTWPSPPPVPQAFDHISWPITHIDFGSTSYSDLHPHIGHLSSSLVSLSIRIPLDLPPHPPYTLSRLQSLMCFVVDPSHTAPFSALPLLAERLILPNLNTFFLQTTNRDRPNQIKHCAAFCRRYGRTLRTVDVQPFRIGWEDSQDRSEQVTSAVQDILDGCPHLEHLILPSSFVTDRQTFELSHPRIKWIDFWTLGVLSCLDAVDTTNFPALKGVREILLSASILFTHIPTDIPPHLNLEEPFEFDFPGFFLRHGPGRIYRCDAVDSIGEEYSDSDSSDESYCPESGSESSDSGPSELGNAELSEDEWEADHEGVLAIYDHF